MLYFLMLVGVFMLIDVSDDLEKRVNKIIEKYPLDYCNKKHAVNKLLTMALDDLDKK